MLKEFYESHPNKDLLGKVTNVELTHLQKTVDVYEPIEAYVQKWTHVTDNEGNFVSASPVEGTKKRNDLPPLYLQWKADYRKRFLHV